MRSSVFQFKKSLERLSFSNDLSTQNDSTQEPIGIWDTGKFCFPDKKRMLLC